MSRESSAALYMDSQEKFWFKIFSDSLIFTNNIIIVSLEIFCVQFTPLSAKHEY